MLKCLKSLKAEFIAIKCDNITLCKQVRDKFFLNAISKILIKKHLMLKSIETVNSPSLSLWCFRYFTYLITVFNNSIKNRLGKIMSLNSQRRNDRNNFCF